MRLVTIWIAAVMLSAITLECKFDLPHSGSKQTCQNPPKQCMQLRLEVDTSCPAPENRSTIISQTVNVLCNRLKGLGIQQPLICTDGGNIITCYLPKKSLTGNEIKMLAGRGKWNFIFFLNRQNLNARF